MKHTTCKHCGKSEPEITLCPNRPMCTICKKARLKSTKQVVVDMPLHKEAIRNLEGAKNWITTEAAGKYFNVTTTSVRTSFRRLRLAGLIERRVVTVPAPTGQGGVRSYYQYKQTDKAAEVLVDYYRRTAAREPKVKAVEVNPRATGHPWFDLGLDCRPNFKTNSNQHCQT